MDRSPPSAPTRTRSPEQKRMSARVGLSVLRDRASSPALGERTQSPAPNFDAFIEVVRKDDCNYIADLLVQHPSLVSLRHSTNHATALHVAAMEGRAGAVKALLGAAWKDQILNVTNDEGWTPLMQAAAAGHAPVCKQLLEAGAYVRCETRSQTTPLHYVARWLPEKDRDTSVIISIIDLFLSCGAPINAANAHGVTPLHEAAQMGSHEVVRFLLKRGANPAALDKFSQTPHSLAARRGFTEVCKAFTDREEKQRELKEKEKEREIAAALPPLSEEDRKRLEFDQHSSLRLNPLTGDRRSLVPQPNRSMALTLALYSGPDRPSSPSVPPPLSAPVSASAPVSSPLSIISAVPLSSLASSPPVGKSSLSQSRPFSSPPTSPKGIFIHHNPEESNAESALNQSAIVSPRRSVNKALAPLTTSSIISPPRTHPVSPPTRASVAAPLAPIAPVAAPIAPIAPSAPIAAVSSSSPPLANPLNPAKASSPPLTALPVLEAASNNVRSSNDALRASSAALGPEHQEWFCFLIECGIPIGSAPRYAMWLVKEGVEVESSRDLPDDLMKVLTFSNVVAAPDLVTLYKRYWTLRGSSLK